MYFHNLSLSDWLDVYFVRILRGLFFVCKSEYVFAFENKNLKFKTTKHSTNPEFIVTDDTVFC